LFLVGDELADAPDPVAALSNLCTLGDRKLDCPVKFSITVMASCYEPSLAVNISTKSRRSLVAIPTVLAPDVKDLPAVRDDDRLCRYYVLCGGHMRSAARLVRAANGKKTETDVNVAIEDVKKTANQLANQLVRDGQAAPHEMVLGIAAALCGAPFQTVHPYIHSASIAGAISTLYGATNIKARGVNLLALMDLEAFVDKTSSDCASTAPPDVQNVVNCLGQWLTELRRADGPCTFHNPHLAKSFEWLFGAGTALSFAWHCFLSPTRVTFSTVFERVAGETKLHPDDGTRLNHLEVTTAPVRLVQNIRDLNAALNTLQPGQYSLFEQENHPTIDLYAYSAPVLSTHQYKLTLENYQFAKYAEGINGIAKTISASAATGKVPPRAVHLFVTPLKYAPENLALIKLPKGHYFAAVSVEESSCCDNLLWCYSCIAKFKSSSADDARKTR